MAVMGVVILVSSARFSALFAPKQPEWPVLRSSYISRLEPATHSRVAGPRALLLPLHGVSTVAAALGGGISREGAAAMR